MLVFRSLEKTRTIGLEREKDSETDRQTERDRQRERETDRL